MLPADMAPSLLTKAASSDAVLAPAAVRHVRDAMLCYIRGARLSWIGADLQVSRLLLGLNLGLALVALHVHLGARLLLHGRRDQNIAHLVHEALLWTRCITGLVVWWVYCGLTNDFGTGSPVGYRLTPCLAKGTGLSSGGSGILTIISLTHRPPSRRYSAM